MTHALTYKNHSFFTFMLILHSAAQKAKSPADLVRSLEAMDIPSNANTQSFAQELFRRTPRAQSRSQGSSSSSSAAETAKRKRKEEAEALKLLEMNDSYGLLIDEEDSRKAEKKKSKKSSSSSKEKSRSKKEEDPDSTDRKREKKLRKKEDNAWESDEDEKEYRRKKMEELERESRPPKTEGKLKAKSKSTWLVLRSRSSRLDKCMLFRVVVMHGN